MATDLVRSVVLMDTVISMRAVRAPSDEAFDERTEHALDWFREVERVCSRFDPRSEVMQLTARVGEDVEVGPLLFETIAFAMDVARESDGAFDPTVGYAMESLGFNRHYTTGHRIVTPIEQRERPTYRDVMLDVGRHTVRLSKPLVLDLGAVAKGLAIDLAARELRPLGDFSIDAGGDVYVAGRNERGDPWRIGVRHPRREGEMLAVLRVADVAVCTSGDYERRSTGGDGGHHILDPRTDRSASDVTSATVVAQNAMLADALSTAAFVLGPERGLALLERFDVDGMLVTRNETCFSTPSLARYLP